jgi:hypothetical protein
MPSSPTEKKHPKPFVLRMLPPEQDENVLGCSNNYKYFLQQRNKVTPTGLKMKQKMSLLMWGWRQTVRVLTKEWYMASLRLPGKIGRLSGRRYLNSQLVKKSPRRSGRGFWGQIKAGLTTRPFFGS